MTDQPTPAKPSSTQPAEPRKPEADAAQPAPSKPQSAMDEHMAQHATLSIPSAAAQTDAKPDASASHQQKCSACGQLNRPGLLICEHCGTSLISATATILGTQKLPKEMLAAAGAASPKPDTGEINALKSVGSDHFQETMILKLEVEGSTTPILVYPRGETSLGRRDPSGGTTPDVDLTAYAAYRMGVSRRHALLRIRDGHLQLEDLGSSNGTLLNGVKLAPHQPRALHDGDTVTLGKMGLRVVFQMGARR